MSREAFRSAFFVTAVIALIVEIYFQFIRHDQQLTVVFAILGIGLMIASRILTPNTPECASDCPKCRESES